MIYKTLALLSIGAAATFLLTLYYYIFELRLLIQGGIYSYNPLHPLRYALLMFTVIYLMIGLVNVTIGILSAVKRYHVLIGIFSLAIFYKLGSLFTRFIIFIFRSVFQGQDINAFSMYSSNNNIFISIISFIIPLFVGSILLLFGLYMFHKYSDI